MKDKDLMKFERFDIEDFYYFIRSIEKALNFAKENNYFEKLY